MLADISVVVPVFNREKLIIRTLDSIIGQELLPRELIVVDNGSTDSTYNRVERWMSDHSDSKVKMNLLSEPQKGACKARQRGLKNATSTYISFFDSDDVMYPQLIKRAFSSLEEDPEADILCWKSKIILLNGDSRILPFSETDPLEAHLIHTLLRPQGYLVKKDFIESAGGWGKDIKVWNDFELGLRLILNNPRLKYVNEVLSCIFAQKESITGLDFSSKEGEWEKTLAEMKKTVQESDDARKEKIIGILDYRKVILSAIYKREGNRAGALSLYRETMKNKKIKEKIPLWLAYQYTSKGLQGAWHLVRFFY